MTDYCLTDLTPLHTILQEFILTDLNKCKFYELLSDEISRSLCGDKDKDKDKDKEKVKDKKTDKKTDIEKDKETETETETETKPQVKHGETFVEDFPTGKETGILATLCWRGNKFRLELMNFSGEGEPKKKIKKIEFTNEQLSGTGEALFNHIAEVVDDYITKKQLKSTHFYAGLIFQFPYTQTHLNEAILTNWTDDITATGVVGKDVCVLLQKAFNGREDLNITIKAVVNDIVGNLLTLAYKDPETYILVDFTTTLNVAYLEQACEVPITEEAIAGEATGGENTSPENIIGEDILGEGFLGEEVKKKPEMIVTCQFDALGDGGSLDFLRNNLDRYVDCKSVNKGENMFEKLISENYFGELVRLIIYQLARKKLMFIEEDCEKREQHENFLTFLLNTPNCIKSKYVSDVADDMQPEYLKTRDVFIEAFQMELPTTADLMRFRYICEIISQRSATLLGLVIAALINRVDRSKVTVGISGEIFKTHPYYKMFIEDTLTTFITRGKLYDLTMAENKAAIGAAVIAGIKGARDEAAEAAAESQRASIRKSR